MGQVLDQQRISLPGGVFYTSAFDYDGNNNPVYMGIAPAGSSTANSVWQVRKLVYDGAGNVTRIFLANGKFDFTSAWDDRASLIYL